MGLFDWLKKKPARKFDRAKYGFSTTDSFRLFTEGLRALQVWEGRTMRINYSTDRGRDKESFLTEAIAKFREANESYPNDMLPAFYLAVVCFLDGRRDEALARFEKIVAKDPDGDVGKSAKYNIVSINHGDVQAVAASLGLPQPQ